MKNISYRKNTQIFYFDGCSHREGKLEVDDESVKTAGNILARILLNYIKKGGDINNLTPEAVFKDSKLIF